MLDYLREEAEKAVAHGLFLHALTSALTVPDVAAALRSSDGRTSGRLYRRWFDEYASSEFDTGRPETTLTADGCWKFRCSLLHQHRQAPSNLTGPYERIVFVSDGPFVVDRTFASRNGPDGGGALFLDVPSTVTAMFAAFARFCDVEGASDSVQRNSDLLVRVDPDLALGYQLFGGDAFGVVIG